MREFGSGASPPGPAPAISISSFGGGAPLARSVSSSSTTKVARGRPESLNRGCADCLADRMKQSSPRSSAPVTGACVNLLLGVMLSDVDQPLSANFTVWPGTHRSLERYFRHHGVNSLDCGGVRRPDTVCGSRSRSPGNPATLSSRTTNWLTLHPRICQATFATCASSGSRYEGLPITHGVPRLVPGAAASPLRARQLLAPCPHPPRRRRTRTPIAPTASGS